MTATKKLTSFSVCLQCVFACTIGSGKLLKWIGFLPPYVLVSLGLNVNPGQPGRCSKWHPHGSKLLSRIFDMYKL